MKKINQLNLQNVGDEFPIENMKERICYVLDASFNGLCEYELICRVGEAFYFIPCNENYDPVFEEVGELCVSKVTFEIITKCFNDHIETFEEDGITSVSSLDDLYFIETSLFLCENEYNYQGECISVDDFLELLSSESETV